KTYDASGRLKKDASRGITNITYDNDGRPLKVSFADMSEQEYEWDGMGNHLSTRFNGVSYTGKQYTKMVRKYTGDGRVVDNGVEKYALYPGGFMQDSTYYWYVRDYQGNNIAVMDGSKNLIQQTDYYPYGEPWREPEGQPWLYGGNEQLRLDGINEYDFNARRYNSAEGRFSQLDPLCEKYPWLSPYAYCAGDPVNAIDKDGNLIIFINGMHFGDGGKNDYWKGVDYTCIKIFNDYNRRYYDGAIGGFSNITYSYSFANRFSKGKEIALRDAKNIYASLRDGETIKLVTHSMGGGYGKGFIEGLMEYAKEQGIDPHIEIELDIAPYQSIEQVAEENVPTISLSHGDDIVAGPSLMKNSSNLIQRPFGLLINMLGVAGLIEGIKAHSITSFRKDLIEIGVQSQKENGGYPNIWEERYNRP
ncbi:MAG: hypothetical protein K2H15_02090, partial [Muribaculaceae bacterium]|nr:hypothetical protein [Muribaculaceae bacterium]